MSSDFLWGTIVGSNIEAANRETARTVDNLQEAARIREQGARDIAREKRIQETFRKGNAKIDELRELLREAHGARDVNYANKEGWKLAYNLLRAEFRKIHPDPEKILDDIRTQRDNLYNKIVTAKGYKIAE